MKTRKAIALLLTLCLILMTAPGAFAATKKGSAASVALESYSGTVNVYDPSGASVSYWNGRQLVSGYSISTGIDSSA